MGWKQVLLGLSCGAIALGASGSAAASTIAYTDYAAFLSAVSGSLSVQDFEGVAAGTVIEDGEAVGDITFSFSIPDGGGGFLDMLVTDSFDTTSGNNSLGLDTLDEAFLDGDSFGLSFATPVTAVGLFVITSDPALEDEILLTTPEGSAGNAATEAFVLGDGGLVYFLGLTSTVPVSTASLAFATDGEINFAFNVDDLHTVAVPEPGTLLLVGLGLVVVARLRC